MKPLSSIIITIFFSSYLLLSQGSPPKRPYTKLIYPELNTIWYEVNYDSTMISDTSDAYNSFVIPRDVPDIIEGDYLYSAYYIFGKYEKYTSTYIVKRNVNTGELIWRRRYGIPIDPRQEIVRLMYINDEGNLETINQIKPEPYLTNPWKVTYNNFIHSKRIIDINNGDILFQEIPDYNDTSLFNTSMNYFDQAGIFFKEGDSLRYYELRKDPTPNTYLFDYYGSLIHHTSKKSDVNEKKLVSTYWTAILTDMNQTNPARLNENKYLFVESKDEESKLFFRYTDKEMNVLEEYLCDQSLGTQTGLFQLNRISDDQQRFLFYNYLPSEDPAASGNYKWDILILDRQAKLQRKVEMSHKYARSLEVLEWNDDNSMKLIGNRRYGSSATNDYRIGMDLINIDKDGLVTVLKTFFCTDSLKHYAVAKSVKVGDDRYLIKFWEAAHYYNANGIISSDVNSKAMSHMMIDASSFDIESSTVEINKSWEADIYPNPTIDILYLDFVESYKGNYTIFDNNGRTILQGTIHNETRPNIDVSCLNSNVYYIRLEPVDKTKEIKNLKFVKLL